jgi:anaerobic selenocysteine-containing dehydrogenase
MMKKVVRSLCGLCHTNCGILVHREDGKISRIEGDPEHPANRGSLCSKAQTLKPTLESEQRLKYPLRRTKNGLTRVSWEEALEFAAEKLMKIKQEYGPESLFRCIGAPVTYSARDGFQQLVGLYGSPNRTGASNLCHVPRSIAFNDAFGGRPEPDFTKSNLVIFWASNPINTTRYTGYTTCNGFNRIIPRLKSRGAKIIVIDPVRAEIVDHADDWVRPNLGADTALGLAMAHTIIEEGIYDRPFVEKWLLNFDEIKRHVLPFTPSWAEKISGVPADRIKALARRYATTDGAIIVDGNGFDMHANGVDMARTVCLLIALTGNLDKPGGNVFMPFARQNSLPTVKTAIKPMGKDQFPMFPEVSFQVFKESMLSGNPGHPRAMIALHANPVLTQANQARTRQALQKLDFLMVVDIFPTATTEIADLVLPAAADLEALDYRAYSSTEGGFLALREKVAEPLGESRSVFEMEYALAEKMSLAKDYPFRNSEEWINYALKPTNLTVSDLRREGIVFATPPVAYHKHLESGFNTPSGKIECCSERFKNAGRGALPVFEPPFEDSAVEAVQKKFSLIATSRRPAELVHTKLANLPTSGRLNLEPSVKMSSSDAQARRIQEGERVEVESRNGTIRLKAVVTDDVVPGLVSIDFGWGNPTDNKASMNLLTRDDIWDPVSGGYPNRYTPCEVKKIDEPAGHGP